MSSRDSASDVLMAVLIGGATGAAWLGVFRGLTPFTPLLEAAFLLGPAGASRMAHRRLREAEERLEPQLATGLDQVVRLTSAVSAASEQTRLRAVRVDATATRL